MILMLHSKKGFGQAVASRRLAGGRTMKEWMEIDGLAYFVDATGKRRRWREYCVGCRACTHIHIEEGTCGPRRITAAIAGSSALAASRGEVLLDNTVHYARCSVCGRRSQYPLEFR
jgi:hypothetical protein